jgi:hypothetical protein
VKSIHYMVCSVTIGDKPIKLTFSIQVPIVDPRAGLDAEPTGRILSPLPGIEPRSPGRPARSETD